jgi:hypothetical protein
MQPEHTDCWQLYSVCRLTSAARAFFKDLSRIINSKQYILILNLSTCCSFLALTRRKTQHQGFAPPMAHAVLQLQVLCLTCSQVTDTSTKYLSVKEQKVEETQLIIGNIL